MLASDSTIYPEGIISGYYGSLTVKAVQNFQIKYGIVSSGTPTTTGYGLAGPETRKKMNEVFSGNVVQTITSPVLDIKLFKTLIGPFAIGMISEQVKLLQQMLATDLTIYPEGKISGVYDDATVKAVQNFQIKYGIVSSGTPTTTGYGLAGPETRKKMNEVFGLSISSLSSGDLGSGQISTTTLATTTITNEEIIKELKEQLRVTQELLVNLLSQLVTLLMTQTPTGQ